MGVTGHLYLAGPMRGKPLYNGPLFLRVARLLREQGFRVVSPWEHDMEGGFNPTQGMEEQNFDIHNAFRWDFHKVVTAKAVVLLPGWRESKGVQAELVVATHCGIPLLEWDDKTHRCLAAPFYLTANAARIEWDKKSKK